MGRHNKMKQMKGQQGNPQRRLMWGGLAILLVGGLTALFLTTYRPAQGESVPIQGTAHVPEGSIVRVEGEDPPSSGEHYEETATRGFHETAVDDGYLIHNLEHGYIIIWYDCSQLDDTACQTLKSDVQKTVEDLGSYKLVAVPRDGMKTPVVLTSWGRIDRLEQYDRQRAEAFIRTFHKKAPEPEGP